MSKPFLTTDSCVVVVFAKKKKFNWMLRRDDNVSFTLRDASSKQIVSMRVTDVCLYVRCVS